MATGPSGRLPGAVNTVGSAIFLNLLWLLCSLPLVTAGAATAALYDSVRKRFIEGHEVNASDFLRTLMGNARQASAIGSVGIAVTAVCLLTFAFDPAPSLGGLAAPVLLGGLALTCLFGWCIPLGARFANSTGAHLRNGLVLGLTHLPSSLLCLVGAGLAFAGVWIYFPLVFVLPVAVMVAWTFRLERAFLRHGYVTAREPAPVARP